MGKVMADVDTELVIDSLREAWKEEAKGESEPLEAAPEPEDSEPELEVEAEDDSEEVSLDGAELDEVEVAADEDDEDGEPEEVFQPPEHWSSDEKETFKSLTQEAQQILLNKDKQFQQGFQERAQSISDIEKAIEPYKQTLAYMGVDEGTAVRTLFSTYQRVLTDPANGILQLAQQFGIMDQLRQQFAPDTDDEFVDPEIKALRQQVQELQGNLGQFQQQTVQGQQQELLSQIESFKAQKDEKGTPIHPYFDQVRLQMAPLVQQGKSMEEAYNEVVWTVPEYRDKHLKTVSAKRKNESTQERAKRVKAAKKAATANKTSGKSQADADDDSLTVKDELRAAWSNLS
jgi:predicted HicB family RNase H-like nuclease